MEAAPRKESKLLDECPGIAEGDCGLRNYFTVPLNNYYRGLNNYLYYLGFLIIIIA